MSFKLDLDGTRHIRDEGSHTKFESEYQMFKYDEVESAPEEAHISKALASEEDDS